MAKVLITDPLSDKGLHILEEAGLEVIYKPKPTDDELHAVLGDVNGWIIRSGTTITADHLKDARNLQVIGRAGVGVDNIDIPAATNHGVVVMNMPDGNTVSAAEHTLALISAVSRNVQLGHFGLMNGEWNRHALVGNELRGKTLGVVGLGRIGREVIKRASAFDMNIIGFDPFVSQDMFDPEYIRVVDIDELTEESDIITLHVPMLDSTRHLFNAERLARMKSSARIVNAARGGIIHEEDLADALNKDVIAGAALDVFESEPLGNDHPLVNAKNILLTPHLGASTFEAKEGVSLGICNQVRDYLVSEKLSNTLNMPVSDMGLLKKLTPFLELAETLGHIQTQLANGPIKNVSIECYGNADESKMMLLAFLKGLLKDMTDNRLNFVNASAIAEERGITVSHSYNSESMSFSNLIMSHVLTEDGTLEVAGSIFGDQHPRIVDIMGFEVDVKPIGNMLFIKNKDVPGVIGKIGTILGDSGINIGGYQLGRSTEREFAYAIIRCDEAISDELITNLNTLDEILDIQQLHIS
jgi:D-3-phosphoglycerate dehydrogenase